LPNASSPSAATGFTKVGNPVGRTRGSRNKLSEAVIWYSRAEGASPQFRTIQIWPMDLPAAPVAG